MRIDIISGFLGAGKTTLIKKILQKISSKEKILLLENELGEIGIDGHLFKSSNILVKEIYSGCICCTLQGDLVQAIEEITEEYDPQRILIEPSGVAKVSMILQELKGYKKGRDLYQVITVVDPLNFYLYLENFPDFYQDQIREGTTLILSRTQLIEQKKIEKVSEDLKKINKKAPVITLPWSQLDIQEILYREEKKGWKHLLQEISPSPPPFQIWGTETKTVYPLSQLQMILITLDDQENYGRIIRAKGILKGEDGWYLLNYSGGEKNLSPLEEADSPGICIIGENLQKESLATLFQ